VAVVSLWAVGVMLLVCCRCGVRFGNEVSHSCKRCLFIGLWVKVFDQC